MQRVRGSDVHGCRGECERGCEARQHHAAQQPLQVAADGHRCRHVEREVQQAGVGERARQDAPHCGVDGARWGGLKMGQLGVWGLDGARGRRCIMLCGKWGLR